MTTAAAAAAKECVSSTLCRTIGSARLHRDAIVVYNISSHTSHTYYANTFIYAKNAARGPVRRYALVGWSNRGDGGRCE